MYLLIAVIFLPERRCSVHNLSVPVERRAPPCGASHYQQAQPYVELAAIRHKQRIP